MFGDAVRSQRRRLGLTQEQLAERTGVSVRSIGKIEANRVDPRPVTVRLLADAFGLTGAERHAFVDLAVTVARGEAATHPAPAVRDTDAPPTAPGAGPRDGVPRQLPPALARLVGRDAELTVTVTALAATPTGAAPVVIAIHGPGGVGKSALAVAAAHAAAPSFPDGQLYVDLQGSAPALAPLAVPDVVGRFLRALGVGATQVPATEAEAVALYRTLMAGRRILVVADNAGSAAQVAALMPVTPGSAMIATSRQVLGMLDGAARVDLEPLREADAAALLASIAGPARAHAEPAALATVAQACGRLPLALRIAGARLVSRPDWTVTDLARRLADERRTLRELSAADQTLRASLQVSWRELRADVSPVDAVASRLFLALGAIRVPSIRPGLAAALCATTGEVAELALDRLVEVRLVECDQDRYRMHDLLRLYAAELALGEPGRHELIQTALLWYASGADQVGRRMRGVVRPSGRPQADVLDDVNDAPSAGAWLDGERANIVALVRQALTEDAPTCRLAAELVLALYPAVLMRGHHYEFEVLCRLVVDAADRVRDPGILALIWTRLAVLYGIQSRTDQALECLDRALPLHRLAGDRSGEGAALEAAGMAYMRLGQAEQALSYYEAARRIRSELGERAALGVLLSNLAEAYHRLGRSDDALEQLRQSLDIRREVGDPAGEAITLLNLGEVYGDLGRLDEAERMAGGAIECSRRAGERENEWRAADLRARVRLRTGDLDGALADCELVLQLTGSPDNPVDLTELVSALEAAGQLGAAGRLRRRTALDPAPTG